MLDAGCGKGFITEILSGAGFQCVGVDVSECAIDLTPKESSVEYFASSLEAFKCNHRFDIVLCADVLYHLVDDSGWAEAVCNLLQHLEKDGALIIVEAFIKDGRSAPHVKWRTLNDYECLARELSATCRVLDIHEEQYSKDCKTFLELRRSSPEVA